jgi:NAD(P)H-hydrate epimerase
MNILLGTQFRAWDKYTIAHEPISSINLMERASVNIAQLISERWGKETPVYVFAGPGNNGGDALAIARLLSEQGYSISVYLMNPKQYLTSDCETNKQRLLAIPSIKFTEVTTQMDTPTIPKESLIIDGLFGTGLNQPLSGGYAMLVKFINNTGCDVLSIDIPSGLMCEDNTCNDPQHIIRATVTATVQGLKLAFLFPENYIYIGEVKIVDIGLHPDGLNEMKIGYSTIEKSDVERMIKTRNPYAHKGSMGHGLLIAGKYGMAGAATLAGKASLRTGLGKISIHTPTSNNDIIQISIPEAIVSHNMDMEMITHIPDSILYTAVAMGPGIGTSKETANALHELLTEAKIRVVLDADALNCLGMNKEWLELIPQDSIITPHPKEFDALVTPSTSTYERIEKAKKLARDYRIYVILKGHHTAICTPEGHTYLNTSGNAGMATAGSGDVLTGIILSLLCQHYTPREACLLGVFLHGRAGDIYAEENCEESLTASDIIQYIPKAIRSLKP